MIADKSILFFCNNLGFELLNDVVSEIKDKNSVHFLIRKNDYSTDIRSSKYSCLRIVNRIIDFPKRYLYNREMIKQIGNNQYDYFIAFGYYQVSAQIIKRIKYNNPKCVSIVYFYDSFCRLNFSNDIKLFDSAYTFDRVDALIHGIHYLPFFCKIYPQKEIKYDLCHIGLWSPGHYLRVPILYYLKSITRLRTFFKCTYVDFKNMSHIKRTIFYIRCLRDKEYKYYLRYFKIYRDTDLLVGSMFKYQKILEIEAASRCIVEINSPRAGLSPRVINALANGKKVVINNPQIKDELFYSANNIYIIDSECPKFDKSFLETQFENFDYTDLQITHWLDILCGNSKNKYDVIESL